MYEASRGDKYCEFVLDPSHMAICSCIQGDEKQRQGTNIQCHLLRVLQCLCVAADRVVSEYNARLKKLEIEFKHNNTMNFGVSYQPSFKDFPVGKYKQSYFSGFDW